MTSMKKLQTILMEIRQFCEAHADESLVKKYARFFTEGWDAYGLSAEMLLEQKETINRKYEGQLSLDDYIQLGDLLIQSGKYEEASFAIRLLDPFPDEFKKSHFQKIGHWLDHGISNWAHTDVLCGEILSKFMKRGIASLNDISEWRESSCKWKRRAVLVTAIDTAKNAKTDTEMKPLLEFIEPMMQDEDRFVHQGLGWFLREAWKNRPKPVEAFLMKHKDTAPRKIYQYATEKMSKEQKERFRACKKK